MVTGKLAVLSAKHYGKVYNICVMSSHFQISDKNKNFALPHGELACFILGRLEPLVRKCCTIKIYIYICKEKGFRNQLYKQIIRKKEEEGF